MTCSHPQIDHRLERLAGNSLILYPDDQWLLLFLGLFLMHRLKLMFFHHHSLSDFLAGIFLTDILDCHISVRSRRLDLRTF